MHASLFKLSFNGFFSMIPKNNLKYLCVYNCSCLYSQPAHMVISYQSMYDLTNPTGLNLICINPCSYQCTWLKLISFLGFTDPLGCRLISALVLTSHLKCHTILLMLLCLTTLFHSSPRLFLFSIQFSYISIQIELLQIINHAVTSKVVDAQVDAYLAFLQMLTQ